jgi:predicted dehydrogenase
MNAPTGTAPLRLGMVGGGRGAFIGAVHRMAARLDGHYHLVAGALASDPARAVASALELGIAGDRAYPDYATMATRERARPDGIDAVAIVTPNDSHYPIARAFLEVGIHVICDKPMTTTLADAQALAEQVQCSGLVFVLTHNYSGYPLVREARERVRRGDIGTVRVAQVEYPQDWLTRRVEDSGQKQAAWRVDPARAGRGGAIGDLGTHAHQLLRFVTGLEVDEVSANLAAVVPGRTLDDDAQVLMRLSNRARAMLWVSQVCPGNQNGLRIRVYGDRGGLEWAQEEPNSLRVSRLDAPSTTLFRAGPELSTAAAAATRIPPGHPEGYLEAFAQIYSDAAALIRVADARMAASAHTRLVPGVQDGVAGARFVEACVASSAAGGRWVSAQP